jgi:gas vesicle protein
MATLKGMAAGAAIGTFLGSLAVIFYPKRREIIKAVMDQTEDLRETAKNYAHTLLNNRKGFGYRKMQNNTSQIAGGLLGLAVGVGTAMLLTPKTGRQLRSQISKAYNQAFGKTQEVVRIFKNNSHPFQIKNAHRKKVAVAKKKTKVKTRA